MSFSNLQWWYSSTPSSHMKILSLNCWRLRILETEQELCCLASKEGPKVSFFCLKLNWMWMVLLDYIGGIWFFYTQQQRWSVSCIKSSGREEFVSPLYNGFCDEDSFAILWKILVFQKWKWNATLLNLLIFWTLIEFAHLRLFGSLKMFLWLDIVFESSKMC